MAKFHCCFGFQGEQAATIQRAFIVVEGSSAETRAATRRFLSRKPIYLAWGAKEGGSKVFMESIVKIARGAQMKSTTRSMPDVGHGFPADEVEKAAVWIEDITRSR